MTKDYLARQFKNYHEVTGDVVTPQMFGAVGDGITDDTQAIQAAFNVGGNIYFPIGTYLVSGYVSVKSNTNVRGEYGKSIIIIDQTKDTDGTIVYFGMSGYGIENVLFENMVIHGSETYGVPQHGISCSQIWESENITFKNCIFRNNLYAASIMINSNKVSYFGCRFEATDCGIQCLGQYPCSDITIKDCFFSGLSYYNNFTNYQSEPIAIYQGIKDNGTAKRWVIDSCEFEYKHTNAIAFGNSNLLPTGEDKTQVENCSIRNITARSVVGVMAFTACRNVIAENIFYDGTDNAFPQTSSLYNIANFNAYCDSVTVRCVKSDNDELLAPFAFAATSKNCMIDDAQIYGATSTSPTIQLQGTNHTLKGVIVNAKTKNGAVQYQNVTNSYVDVKASVGSAYPIIHSFAVNSTNTGNTIVVYEDSLYPITKLNNVTSTSIANANTFDIVTESIIKKSVTTTRYINSSDLCSIVNVSIADSATFEACMTTYDSWGLLEDGHKMTVEFNCAQALSSRDFKLPSTGNILPINSDTYKLAPATTYTVVEEFIQLSGKWVEVKRYIRYADGRIINLASSSGSTNLPWITPQDYGAKGDGTTDDTQAVQSAFDAVNTAGGGVIYFPKGVYKLIPTTTLKLYSNTTILGDRGESIIACDPEFSASTVMIGIGSASRSATNVHVRGITFRGVENYGSAQSGLRLVEIWQSTNVSFVDCLFQNNMNAAIKLVNSSNIQVFDSRFEAVDCGVISQGTAPVNDVTIRGCHFTGISSLNSFTNFNSENISIFCGEAATEPCRRWRIEDCVFEHKATCAVLIGVNGEVTGGGHIACKDIIVRNCTFGGMLSAVTVVEAEDVLLDGLFFDDTPKVMPNSNIHTLLHFRGSKNCIVKNVVSRCTQFVFTLIRFGDTYNSNITIDGVDAIVPYNESNITISMMFATNSDSSIKNSNITIKNVILHDNAKNANRATQIQYANLENSYIDVTPARNETLVLSNYIPSANVGTVTNNKIIVNTLADIRRNWSPSISVADSNEWIIVGNGAYNASSLPTSINQQRMPRMYNVTIPNSTNYDASLAVTDFYLMNDGYDFYINFIASTYTAGKPFTFAKTGNIVPIDKPFIFSNDYKVVCHFVQKNAKYVEVERTYEYYEGANINVPVIEPMAVTTMPTASASEEGNIYLYMGATDAVQRLSQGATYQCVSDGNGGYGWLMVSINLEALAAMLQNSTTFDDFKAIVLGTS